MTSTDLARLQFAFTSINHFFFVPVTMGLATTVRFYETLIEPFEKIQPAHILVSLPLSKDCCQTRHHFIAASGLEVLSDALPAAGGH